MAYIASVAGRTIRDSRGQPTVEVTLTSDAGVVATASLPVGRSLGKYEAPSVAADRAVETITTVVAPAIVRQPCDERAVDAVLESLYLSAPEMGTNSVLGVSLAAARLGAAVAGVSLFERIFASAGGEGYSLPTPMFNLINGGKHAHNNLDFQEYLVIPLGLASFHQKLAAGRKIFIELGKLLAAAGQSPVIGDEGGYAPNLSTNEEGLGLLVEAIKRAGLTPGGDVWLGLDVAAASLGSTFQPTVAAYASLFDNFPLLSIEDPFGEDDWENWRGLKDELSKRDGAHQPKLLVGDDLFVGDRQRVEYGISQYCANALLIKICQTPTLTAMLSTIDLAKRHNYVPIVSHRSGDTLDSFIADLAVATTSAFIKAGAPNDGAPERMTKYERLVQIEESLTNQGQP